MDVLPCGHAAHEGDGRLCPHLVGPEADMAHYRLLRGRRLEADFICANCDDQRIEDRTPELIVACEGCVDRVESEVGEILGWRGSPGIEDRPEPLRPVLLEPLDGPGIASPRAVCPVDWGWVTVSPSDEVWIHTLDQTRRGAVVGGVLEPRRDQGNQPSLAVHASADGRFVAVVNDYGRTGVVVDATSGETTMRLDRGDYHPEQTPFPAAFVTGPDGDVVLLAATDWNRVDAFDPASGALLTPREPTSYRHGDERPPHYLDCALHPSPDGRWVLDDGWFWHPFGIPSVWSVERWLGGHVWEAEDGPSRAALGFRGYLWDVPMCWVDDRTVAIWGLGADDEAMLDGVSVYDVEDVVRLGAFAGVPRGQLWSGGRRLYAATAKTLSVWDPYTGHRTAHLDGLTPLSYNRPQNEFLVDHHNHPHRLHLIPLGEDHVATGGGMNPAARTS